MLRATAPGKYSLYKYGNVCGWGWRGEVAKTRKRRCRDIDDDDETKRSPATSIPSEGLGRDGPIPLLLLLADVPDIDSWSRFDLGSVALPTNVTVLMKVSTREIDLGCW